MHFPYDWKLSDLPKPKKNAPTVFSLFCCGGGSSMGYKLAGYNVLGGCDIDPRVLRLYRKNLNPKYLTCDSVANLVSREDIPEELFNLDVLDMSPPCSTFSASGLRDRAWGIEKKFREGQAEQVLDQLFFHAIDVANRLRPKVVIAENVAAMARGKAAKYVVWVHKAFHLAGYTSSHYLLNASTMGVPQSRERIFFVAIRKDLEHLAPITKTLVASKTKVDLNFNLPEIPLSDILGTKTGAKLSNSVQALYDKLVAKSLFGNMSQVHPNKAFFSNIRCDPDRVMPTLTASFDCGQLCHPWKPAVLSQDTIRMSTTFPADYDFLDQKPGYIMGMSVPPVMMAQVATRIKELGLF